MHKKQICTLNVLNISCSRHSKHIKIIHYSFYILELQNYIQIHTNKNNKIIRYASDYNTDNRAKQEPIGTVFSGSNTVPIGINMIETGNRGS